MREMPDGWAFSDLQVFGAEPGVIFVVSNTGRRLLEDLFGGNPSNLFQVPPGEPTLENLRLLDLSMVASARTLIGVGGGSVIDYSKVLAVAANYPERISDLSRSEKGAFHISNSSLGKELFAVPTTLGSGAEVSSSAVISLAGRKIAFYGKALRPRHYLWDPQLINPNIEHNVHGMLDLLGHAFESLFSRRESRALDYLSIAAINRVFAVMGREKLSEFERFELQMASTHAGFCQDLRLVSLPHALAHHFSSHGPHGLLVGHFLESFIRLGRSENFEGLNRVESKLLDAGMSLSDLQKGIQELISLGRITLENEVLGNEIESHINEVLGDRILRMNKTPTEPNLVSRVIKDVFQVGE